MSVVNLHQADAQRDALDPIACFRKETKRFLKDAKNYGNESLVSYLEAVLDFIEYTQIDIARLDWLVSNKHELIKRADRIGDLRAYIDKKQEAE